MDPFFFSIPCVRVRVCGLKTLLEESDGGGGGVGDCIQMALGEEFREKVEI